jgi:hypothetical protein
VHAKPTLAPIPLRFEEKLRQHLNLDDGSELAALLKDSRVFGVVAGLLQAFLVPTSAPAPVVEVLKQQRNRGRLRKQAIPRAVNALINAAGRYRDLDGLETRNPALAEQMEQEAFRLVLQENRWEQLHNEKRLGFKGWIFLVTLEDFLKFWTESQGQSYTLTNADLLRLQKSGEYALGWQPKSEAYLPVADDLRGLAHFRANPRNRLLCELAARYARRLASTLDLRPFLIFRNEV